ncbi:hypothetical protein Y032_0063g3455 [Ancylostoma ceylanicum]|uniref:Uncharacterized protein n=1 Tax=Ancylostoma ceylanicum TaxID=53326 RepID=A0A016U2Y8_9BILA|nr:hypothetical protein Y032_0063g3455 [Ancylostoma ceylanicum]
MFNPESTLQLSEAERDQSPCRTAGIGHDRRRDKSLPPPPATQDLLPHHCGSPQLHGRRRDLRGPHQQQRSPCRRGGFTDSRTDAPSHSESLQECPSRLHVRVPRSSNPAKYGGKGVKEILIAENVPVAPLTTTFRAHPGLNNLLNFLFYEGALVNGTAAEDGRLLLKRCLDDA